MILQIPRLAYLLWSLRPVFNSTTPGGGLGRPNPSNILAWGLGGIFSIAEKVVTQAPRYLLHGFNKRRTLQGRGRFQGRKKRR